MIYWKQILGIDSFFWALGTKTSVFWRKFFDGFVKAAFNVSRVDFWVNCFSYEFFQLLDCFPTVGRTFCNLFSKTLESLLQLSSTWTTKLFLEISFPEENTYFYTFFELWSKTLRTFVEIHSTRFQKLILPLVQVIFLHIIIFFSRNFTLTDGLWRKMFGIH